MTREIILRVLADDDVEGIDLASLLKKVPGVVSVTSRTGLRHGITVARVNAVSWRARCSCGWRAMYATDSELESAANGAAHLRGGVAP